jgi:hypothetical protein
MPVCHVTLRAPCQLTCAGECDAEHEAVVLIERDNRQAVASYASFRAFDRDAQVVALALDRIHLAVELADSHDAVPESDVA